MLRSVLGLGWTLTALVPLAAQGRSEGSATVSVQALSQHLKDRDLVLLQLSVPDDYTREHIPGTRYVQPGELENPMTAGMMVMDKLPTAAHLHANLEKLGISDNSNVVVVFTRAGIPQATRVLFLLTYAGLEHVAVLDGGFNAWKAAGLPVTAAVPAPATAGHITAHGDASVGVDYSYVQGVRDRPKVKLIDARAPSYFSGPPADGMGMAAGHIPGAVNIPYTSLVDDSARVLPKAKIEQLFRAAGVQPGDTVVAYCHVGIQATVVILGARMLGNPVHLYVGSFHDWSDHKLPTEGGKP